MLKDYKSIGGTDPNQYSEGTCFWSSDGTKVTNYPKIHIANGIKKNNETNYRYKYVVRMFKKIRNNMVNDKIVDGDAISSFLTECLVWNVPNRIIMGYDTWTETIRQSIIYLFHAINDNEHTEWGEVSEKLYLFHSQRKWDAADAKAFMKSMWNYLGYNK